MVAEMVAVKKDCIGEFIDAWQQYDDIQQRQSHSPVRYIRSKPIWAKRFRDAGYHEVRLNSIGEETSWLELQEWCDKEFGSEHYTWTGTIFWFETEQDAVLFALKWT